MEVLLSILTNPVPLITLMVILSLKASQHERVKNYYQTSRNDFFRKAENWSVQKYGTNIGVAFSVSLLILQVLLYMTYGSTTAVEFSIIGIWLVGILILIYQTENKIHRANP